MTSPPALADDSNASDGPTAAEVDQYLSSIRKPGFTDLAGIRAEYLDASANFPFDLPNGVAFPTTSNLRNSDSVSARKAKTPEIWEYGLGITEAYFVWQTATVLAANWAQSEGNSAESHRLLDALDAGYGSSVRKAFLEDPEGIFPEAVDRARRGDFTSLVGLAA